MVELETKKNVREKAEAEARNLRDEVDRWKGKVEEIKEEVRVRPENRVEGGKNGNGIEQVRLKNIRAKSKEGIGK